mgnify:CR=1 FL=1
MNNEEKVNQAGSIKLPWHAHVIAGWPLAMIAIGGLIGGACGGLAYGVSMSLINKKGISAISYILSAIIGISCIALYFIVIIGLSIAFPQLFNQQ